MTQWGYVVEMLIPELPKILDGSQLNHSFDEAIGIYEVAVEKFARIGAHLAVELIGRADAEDTSRKGQ